MARFLGATHSVVSKIRRGLQGPGERLLAALALHPSVNARWLNDGIGDPILRAAFGTRPISEVILPGPPATCQELFGAERYPIAPVFDSESTYFLRVTTCTKFVSGAVPGILPGDLLLIETASEYLARTEHINQKLCAVALPSEAQKTYVLAKVFVDRERLYVIVRQTSHPQPPPPGTPKKTARKIRPRRSIDSYNAVRPKNDSNEVPKTTETPASAWLPPECLVSLDSDAVLGVVLQLHRPNVLPVETHTRVFDDLMRFYAEHLQTQQQVDVTSNEEVAPQLPEPPRRVKA